MEQVYRQRLQWLYGIFRLVADNTHGNTAGFHGSLSYNSLYNVLFALGVFGVDFLDFGAGDGRVLAAALIMGSF